MSKYIKLEDAISLFGRSGEYHADAIVDMLFFLPTIEVSEDCISREYILGEAFTSDEYNGETKSFDLPVVSVRDIEDAPSVVPSREEGEWVVKANGNNECSICGREKQNGWINFCGFCGSRMRGKHNDE